MNEAPILLYPGETSDLVLIDDVLRKMHEESAAARLRDIETAAANGAPDAGDGPLKPLPPYVSSPLLRTVRARFVVLREPVRRKLAAREGAAWARLKAAGDDVEAQAAATDLLFLACRDLIAEAVVALVVGERCLSPKDAEDLDVLERNKLVLAVANAAAAFQELGPGKVSRSGLSLGSTSGASIASPAPSIDAHSLDATVAPAMSRASPPTSQALGSRPTPVLGGT